MLYTCHRCILITRLPHILPSTVSAGCCLAWRVLSARLSVDLAPCLAGASSACPGTFSHAELLGWWWLSHCGKQLCLKPTVTAGMQNYFPSLHGV